MSENTNLSKDLKTLTEQFYKSLNIKLNVNLTDKEIPINSKYIYFSNIPIAIKIRIANKEYGLISATQLQIMKAPDGYKFGSIFITTVTTSVNTFDLILSDIDVFSDIGIEDRAVLVDTLGVEYDARGHPIGDPIPTIAQLIAGSDGTDLQELLVESTANPNLRVSNYDGATLLNYTTALSDILTRLNLLSTVDPVNQTTALGNILTRLNLLSDVNPIDQTTVLDNILTALAVVQPRQSRQYEYNSSVWNELRHSFNQSVSSINSNGAGSTLSLATTPMSRFTIIVLLTAGSAAFVVDLEGQINGIGWVPLGTLSSSSSIDALHVVNKAVNAIRYNVTTIGASNTMTIGLLASGR